MGRIDLGIRGIWIQQFVFWARNPFSVFAGGNELVSRVPSCSSLTFAHSNVRMTIILRTTLIHLTNGEDRLKLGLCFDPNCFFDQVVPAD